MADNRLLYEHSHPEGRSFENRHCKISVESLSAKPPRRPQALEGRPVRQPQGAAKGLSRSVQRRFLRGTEDVWQERGRDTLRAVATRYPIAFLKIAASIVLRQASDEPRRPPSSSELEQISDEELEAALGYLREAGQC